MANSILKNDIRILRCANWATECFFNHLSEVIESERLKDNRIILELLEELDQNMQGHGLVMVEITEFFGDGDDKLPIKLFYDLSMKAIAKIKQQNFGEFQSGYFALLDEFSSKIL